MEKLKINSDICIGCGACMATSPDIIELNDEGVAQVIDENLACSEEIIEELTGICPVGAISCEDTEI